jgi:hypothetical protein
MLAARYARIARGGHRVDASDIRPRPLGRYGQNDRAVALGRRNWPFAGSHSGGERAAAMYSILQTAKLNGVNPEAYFTDTLSQIAAGHPINRISELMPWANQSPIAEATA